MPRKLRIQYPGAMYHPPSARLPPSPRLRRDGTAGHDGGTGVMNPGGSARAHFQGRRGAPEVSPGARGSLPEGRSVGPCVLPQGQSFWELFRWGAHPLFGTGFAGQLVPLTPALSPREREQPGPALGHSHTAGFVDRLAKILPLPEGEGRGEGKRDAPDAQVLKNASAPAEWA